MEMSKSYHGGMGWEEKRLSAPIYKRSYGRKEEVSAAHYLLKELEKSKEASLKIKFQKKIEEEIRRIYEGSQ